MTWWFQQVVPVIFSKSIRGKKRNNVIIRNVFRRYIKEKVYQESEPVPAVDPTVETILEVLRTFCNTKHQYTFTEEQLHQPYRVWLNVTLSLLNEEPQSDILLYIHSVIEILQSLLDAKRLRELKSIQKCTENFLSTYPLELWV